jgi:hypothetical protein
VDSFRAADLAMGSAFRQKLSAYQRALELAGPEPERGFQSQFARDCGSSPTYISHINKIVSDPDLFSALNKHQSVGFNTLLALAEIEPEIKAIALDQLDNTGRLVETDIDNIVTEYLESHSSFDLSEFEEAQIDREIELERLERLESLKPDIDLALITPSDRDIDQIVSSAHSAGQQLRVYLQKTRAPLETEKLATFIEIFATDLASSFGDDPEVYSGVISEIRLLSENLVTALDQVSDLPRPKLKIVK